jgi:hypothetical protein
MATIKMGGTVNYKYVAVIAGSAATAYGSSNNCGRH